MDVEIDECMDYIGCSLGVMFFELFIMDWSCFSMFVGNESIVVGNIIFMLIVLGVKKCFWIIEDMLFFGKWWKIVFFWKMLDEGMMLEGFWCFDFYEDCKDLVC